jgi:hypothetical protein
VGGYAHTLKGSESSKIEKGKAEGGIFKRAMGTPIIISLLIIHFPMEDEQYEGRAE